MKSAPNGKGVTNAHYLFVPGTEYETTDPVLIEYITGQIGDPRESVVMTQDMKQVLEYYKVPYEITKCSSCPSAKPSLKYNPFKIIEE